VVPGQLHKRRGLPPPCGEPPLRAERPEAIPPTPHEWAGGALPAPWPTSAGFRLA